MYVITFYSFKGGVGRTMALVNVAAELVRRGRKVLVVDFDLEAPGLETYKHLRPPQPHPGIVEFVTEFRRTHTVPDVLDYLYETAPIGKKGGRLWVMPAGKRDRAYRSALTNLDWKRLYRDQGGFILFEDTKKGWETELKPDYVLIDSRTGDTDVLGICTRQLPDSVVLMFTPNEQNLVGLENVCRDIRREETEGLKKKIRLHFVAANAPDLDDEDRVLRRQVQAFRERLAFKSLSGVIRRYESLRLLDQSVFVLDRPRSRLARAYRDLTKILIWDNLADRAGALRFLRQYAQECLPKDARNVNTEGKRTLGVEEDFVPRPVEDFTASVERLRRWRQSRESLNRITHNFWDDPGVLLQVVECRTLLEQFEQALQVLNRVQELEPGSASPRFQAAMCKKRLGEAEGAAQDLFEYLRSPGLGPEDQVRAIQEIHAVAPERILDATRLVDVATFNAAPKWRIALLLPDTDEGLEQAIDLMKQVADCPPGESRISEWEILEELPWRLICAHRGREAITLLETSVADCDLWGNFELDLAMAYWGDTGELPEALCRGVQEEYHRDPEWLADPSRAVARALVLWRLGNAAAALGVLERAEEDAKSWEESFFSFWRYRFVSCEEFLEDCGQVRRMLQGEPIRPPFLGPTTSGTKWE